LQRLRFESRIITVASISILFVLSRNGTGTITLGSAKSLLYRFALRQPMDKVVRSSRIALQAHLPLYNSSYSVLLLPAFIESSLRTVRLPAFCFDKPKKERKSILALMACVRLYQKGLLTDRLLPLSRKDIRKRILAVTEKNFSEFTPITVQPDTTLNGKAENGSGIKMFEYHLIVSGDGLEQARGAFKAEGQRFALLTATPLEQISDFEHHHPELGTLRCMLQPAHTAHYSSEEVTIVSEFFALIMNARWKRRSKTASFRTKTFSGGDSRILVGLLNKSGTMDFSGMKALMKESTRTLEQRTKAVQSLPSGSMPQPRLCCPIYDKFAVYIVYGRSEKLCSSEFPADSKLEGVKTYKEYFQKRWEKEVDGNSPLYLCQRIWKQPRTSLNDPSIKKQRDQQNCEGYEMCKNLAMVYLSKELCMEAPLLADAVVALETVVLPQFLYFLERRLAAKAFVAYCSSNFPTLGRCLKAAEPESIIELLSAQSCNEIASYERLEWLGDAVLQLVQTDAVLNSTDLRNWISNLHEGDLDSVRSIMCSNARLTAACDGIGLDQFILTRKLEKGLYVPAGLELFSDGEETGVEVDASPSEKVRADFIEAILAFVFLSSAEAGYSLARKVADELQITIPWNEIEKEVASEELSRSARLLEYTREITGYDSFRNPLLLQEAFTHQTNPTPRTSSYQRLEWIGDAVLGLAVREYIFNHYPEAEAGKMVLLETPFVANSSLAFLALKFGLPQLLDHRDNTLPGRIDAYATSVNELGRGLFSSDPPKCIADIVESLIGAVYIDGGWKAGRAATLKIVAPIVRIYEKITNPEDLNIHPKRSLLEFCGDLASISAKSDRSTGSAVAVIECLGVELTRVTDISAPAATDRGSALVLSVFEKNAQLQNRFIESRRRMLSAASSMKTKVDQSNGLDQEQKELK